MKISIIVVAYNIENYIERCLKSILMQTLNCIEIIVINDGSTDNTLNIIKSLTENDMRVNIINKSNEGIVEAKKSGIKAATGKYILFVDGDDWIELNTCEKLYNNINSSDTDILIYNAFWAYDNKKERKNTFKDKLNIKKDPISSLLLGQVTPAMWGKLIRREFLYNTKIEYPCNISYGEDLATVSNWFINIPKIDLLDECLYNYYQRESSITHEVSNKILDVEKAISFIEEQLKKNNIYGKYKKEFEFMCYQHIFISKVITMNKLNEFNRQLYKYFKKKHINIYGNRYIMNEINKGNINLKIRIILYLLSLNMGRIYDDLRNMIKNNFKGILRQVL